MSLSTRDDLQKYILRKLGSGVYEVELTPEQLDDIVDDTLQMYEEFIDDGVTEKMLLAEATADAETITLPSAVMGISEVYYSLNKTPEQYSVDPFAIKTRFANVYDQLLTEGHQEGDLTFITVTQMYFNTLKDIFDPVVSFDFNSHTKELTITQSNTAGVLFGMTVYWSTIDSPTTYNHKFVKEYATALAKKQWARNLSKYNNATVVGGMELNWQQLYEEATTELEKLSEDALDTYAEPIGIFIG